LEESLSNRLLWAWGRVCQTGYCGLGGEFVKLVIVGVGESLSNWLLWAWRRVYQTGYCGRGGEFVKLVIVGLEESVKLVIVGVG
jgi:hypothetical protein